MHDFAFGAVTVAPHADSDGLTNPAPVANADTAPARNTALRDTLSHRCGLGARMVSIERFHVTHGSESVGFLQQFVNHSAGFQRGDRAAGMVQEVDVRVDAEDVEHRVMDVRGGDRTVLRGFAEPVG